MFGFTKKRRLEIKPLKNQFIWECEILKKEKIIFSVKDGCEYYIYNKKTKSLHQFRTSGHIEVINPEEQRVFGALTKEQLSMLPIKFSCCSDGKKFSFVKNDKEFEAPIQIDGNIIIKFVNSFIRNMLENRISSISVLNPLYIELFDGMSLNDFTLEEFLLKKSLLDNMIRELVYKELQQKSNSIPLFLELKKVEEELGKNYFKNKENAMLFEDFTLVNLKVNIKSDVYDILEENQNKVILHKSNKEVLQEELEATKVACEINKLRNEDNE